MNASSMPFQTSVSSKSQPLRADKVLLYIAIFCAAFAVFFLGQDRRINVYDEGIVLTAAIRVAAGQVPHRDFYINYGPAQSYVLAVLFKLFGTSALVARLYDVVLKSLVVVSVYAVTTSFCRRSIAAWTAIVCAMWLFGMGMFEVALIPLSLLILWAIILLLPIFCRTISNWRTISAGALIGLSALFRYDIGIAMIVAQSAFLSIAAFRRRSSQKSPFRSALFAIGLYLLGFIAVFLPPAVAYLSVAPFSAVFYDIVQFPAKYYNSGRALPFPGMHLRTLENLAIYLPILVVAISALVIARSLRTTDLSSGEFKDQKEGPDWIAFLIAFSLVAIIMYFKGFVRVHVIQMYLSIFPCLLLIAVLFQHRSTFQPFLRTLVTFAMGISVLAASWESLHELSALRGEKSSVLMRLISPSTQRPLSSQDDWCTRKSPMSPGPCFLMDSDHIAAAEFLSSHTSPTDTLFVGLPQQERIFANDNATYFATARLPATHWSHFDPGLQNRSDIQQEIIGELDARKPPYIALDGEFEQSYEPNDSSRSSGVHLLDAYIHSHYQLVETFGEMTIWRRTLVR